MRVLQTYVRSNTNEAPEPRTRLVLRSREGIVGDCHAVPMSPRHVLLTARGAYERHGLAANALRENILVDVDRLDWSSGSELRISGEKTGRADVVLRVTFACEPCAKLNRFKPGLMRHVGADRGILARVVRGGVIQMGDRVSVRPSAYKALPDAWQERLCDLIQLLPEEEWISYVRLAELVGVKTSYCRVFPRVLGLAAHGGGPTTGALRRRGGELAPLRSGMARGRDASRPMWSGRPVFAGE